MKGISINRISVIGTSCSGKSTFSDRLSCVLGIPHIEMDTLHWGADWTTKEDFLDQIRDTVRDENWIIDGNYREAAEIILPRATTVIFLNLPFTTVFFRALIRTTKRILSGEEFHNGNRETFRGAFLSTKGIPLWVIRTYRRRKKRFAELKEKPEYLHLEYVELFSVKDMDKFIEKTGSM